MIQRIQTIFLALAVASMIAMFFYPVASLTEFTIFHSETLETDYYGLSLYKIDDPSPQSLPHMGSLAYLPMLILAVIIMGMTTFAIFKYRDRVYQLKLVKVAIFINIILIGAVFLNYVKLFSQTEMRYDLQTGAYFPLISLVMLVIAHRYIMKDENLVRSADRLR